jgi:hypothetical protein
VARADSRGHGLHCGTRHLHPEENLGIRIENNIVVTKNGQVDLFKNIPREVDEIEALMKKGK